MSDRHFLIVEPDPVQRQLIDMLLADERSVLVPVDSARAALEYLRSNTPQLIVLAQELPDLSGIGVCKRVKSVQRLARVPVIVTTAEPAGLGIDQSIRQQAEEAGVDLLLPKPLGDKALRERSRRLLAAAEAGVTSSRDARQLRQHTTAVIDQALKELDAVATGEPAATTGGDGHEPAHSHIVMQLTAELETLRDENLLLKRRSTAQQREIDTLKAELDELRRAARAKGLFGRRR